MHADEARPDSAPESNKHAAASRWPWDSPFAWAQPPERDGWRLRSLLASLLARILGPPSGNHHAPPGVPAEDPPAGDPEPEPDDVPLAMTTLLDLDMRAPRVRPYARDREAS